ncbi:hypothetical protein W97_08932 [Coniosporium apollinis CBS 100218]|uniref:Uncharacterized protein n=1 Tax=Coniosporium apollinis (strain CBS 100218) TaxID=1168221 RepID=R7Z673_CONA1|nr:uncharacterized protein W97_08932 [Coniosporium apollinis CBS 100218]EON69680.1 hypothetical protein W97_08932 [Coniosporium apollinis CBS 100218]
MASSSAASAEPDPAKVQAITNATMAEFVTNLAGLGITPFELTAENLLVHRHSGASASTSAEEERSESGAPSFHSSELHDTSPVAEEEWQAYVSEDDEDSEEEDADADEDEDTLTEPGEEGGEASDNDADAVHEPLLFPDATQEPFAYEELDTRELSKYAETLRDKGYMAVVEQVWADEEQTGHQTFQAVDGVMFKRAALRVLTSTHTCLLREIIEGNLAKAYRQDPKVREVLQVNRRKLNMRQPYIYQQVLVDGNGDSPSAQQLLKIVAYLRTYITADDPQLSNNIDNAVGNPRVSLTRSQAGYRRYLAKTSNDQLSRRKRRQLRTFCTNLSHWCDNIPLKEMEEPLKKPLTEFGYTNNAMVRFKDHAAHRQSNYLMNATEAVCRIHFPQFAIERHVIFYIWSADQASVAEVLFHDLGGGYIHTGSGFSHFPAGRSVHSVMNTVESDWNEWMNEAAESSPVIANLTEETRRLRENTQRELAPLRAEIAELQSRKAELQAERDRLDEIDRNRAEEEELERMRVYRDELEAVLKLLRARDG